ncbi:hypothetical protein O1L68_26160 [Streptomyces lydicus]|nr:hypothetical protein [Streptomyces lydicus]
MIVPALALLPVLASVALPGAVAALVAWGAAGWALQVPSSTGCWRCAPSAAPSPSP